MISPGDSFHDPYASARLVGSDPGQLSGMVAGHDWIWLLGNHDPLAPEGLGGVRGTSIKIGPLRFVHEPGPAPQPGGVAGHLHPATLIRARGRRIRRRAFITDGACLVMPSLFPLPFHAWMLGQDKVHAMRRAPVPARQTG